LFVEFECEFEFGLMPADVEGELGPLQLVNASSARPHAVIMNLLIVYPFKWLVYTIITDRLSRPIRHNVVITSTNRKRKLPEKG
jgi:hypothetical protein